MDDNSVDNSLETKLDRKTRRITMNVITVAWLVSVLIAVSVIASALYLMVMFPSQPLPDTLREWGGTTLGFLFGSLFGIVKEFISKND